MARHDQYDDRERRRRRDHRGEGIFDRVRDWFSDRDDEQDYGQTSDYDRDWEYRQRYDRGDYRREPRGIHHPEYSYGQQGWISGRYDRNYGLEDEPDFGQEYDRDYGRGYDQMYGREGKRDYDQSHGRERDRDWERNQEWERTRQWRRDPEQHDIGRNRARTTFGNLYGENYSRTGWDADDYRGDDREGYGRSYNRGRFDRERNEEMPGRAYNRDWEFQRDPGEEDEPRRFYGYGQEYDPERSRYSYYNRDRPQARREQRRRVGRRHYGTAGMRSDFEGSSGQYRTAGMRSDYGSRSADEERRPQNTRESQYDRSYGQDYIGYEREGAFYQDLDEPVNYEYWEIWEIPGEYSGYGPQNYHRSNESINDDICERLTSHGRIDASKLEIEVEDGEVVLKGTVPSREMKRMAEDTAESVSGVRDVRNEIRVQQQERESGRANWESGHDREQSQQRGRDRQREGRRKDQIPTTGMADQSTAGAGLTSGGATSMEAMEAASGAETKRSQLREGMEVIGKEGKVVGRVKEIRQGDFLVDRDMARDVYIPFDAISSVGAQAMLNLKTDDIDDQDWEKPDLI